MTIGFHVVLALLLSCFSAGVAEFATPVQKVISLLTDLKTKVEGEGSAEAATYDAFACFCKQGTKTKSDAIVASRDNIKTFSTQIELSTASKAEKSTDLSDRATQHEAMTKELAETRALLATATSEYQAKNMDLEKAISSLDNAMAAMESSKPSFLAIGKSLEGSFELARALNLMAESRRKELVSLLQTPKPDFGYKYHSQGILDTLLELKTKFSTEKSEADTEWGKTHQTFSDEIVNLEGKLISNNAAMDGLKVDIGDLTGDIAQNRESLVNEQLSLKDDQTYLQDLTERCEVRAKDWDQRSQVRADELTALAGALKILTDEVQGRDSQVNNRTVLLEQAASIGAKITIAAPVVAAKVSKHVAASFFQEATSNVKGFLRGANKHALSAQAKKEKVVQLLRDAGRRLGSTALSSAAVHAAADPFAKVKTLIQQLIERLKRESTMEATKKGFCDEQVSMAEQNRDFRWSETQKINVEVQSLELKEDELALGIQLLNSTLQTLRSDLETATSIREAENQQNSQTVVVAKEGLEAVREAIVILKVFYKKAANARDLLQISPIDEDTSGPGFAGAYRGKQEASQGIIGMLQVIESDFDRTIRTTQAAEAQAHAEFVDLDRSSRADISGKETKKTLDSEALDTTRNKIQSKMEDLTTAQGLLDSALGRLEELKPICIDTSMSFQERQSKRQEELTALKNALCILDTEGVEADCTSSR